MESSGMMDEPEGAAEELELSAVEARVLGSLIEKRLSTPDAYPLTLNALTAACNQTSNRDPVVRHEPGEVERTVLGLKLRGLTRIVHPGSGERSTRYRHVADDALGLDPADQALVCVLLLRGPSTPADLKARTERLRPFASVAEVQSVLDALGRRAPPLVARVERLPGQKEARWIQLLEAGAEERAAAGAAPSPVAGGRSAGRIEELEARVATLEARVAALVEQLGGEPE